MGYVIGIDPGLRYTGVAHLDGESKNGIVHWTGLALSTIVVHQRGPLVHRYDELRCKLQQVLQVRLDAITLVAIEAPEDAIRRNRTAQAVLHLFGAYTVIASECARLFGVKKVEGVLWKGQLTKRVTTDMLRLKYPGAPAANEHEWDALGVADMALEMASRLDRQRSQ